MKPIGERERKHLKKWEKKRQHKWLYIIRHGLTWGVFVSFFSYLLIIRLDFSLFDWDEFMLRSMVFCLVGLFFGLFLFKARDKRYLEVVGNEEKLE